MVGMTLPKEAGRVDENYAIEQKNKKRLVCKFEQFSVARIKLSHMNISEYVGHALIVRWMLTIT